MVLQFQVFFKTTLSYEENHTLCRFKRNRNLPSENFQELCNHLASQDQDLKLILENHGYPPMWTRENTFETLIHIILEQQVSLASALAALNKLKEKLTEITPEKILQLSDEEMRNAMSVVRKTFISKAWQMQL